MSRRGFAMSLLVVVALAGLTACGGSNQASSTGAAGSQAQGQRRGIQISPAVAACLRKQGVTLPFGGRRRGGPPSGGTRTAPAPGTRPRRAFDPERFRKLRAAAKKCGLNLPAPQQYGPGGPGGSGGPPGTPVPAPGTSTTQQ